LRQGDSDRDIARARLMGRPKVAAFRALAAQQGWLAPEAALPDDAALSAAVGQARRARSTISTVEPYRAQVERWLAEGVGGIAIHAALCRVSTLALFEVPPITQFEVRSCSRSRTL
jgi:hypothetical protein